LRIPRNLIGGQRGRRRIDPQPYAKSIGGFHQPGDQRRSVDQLHAAPEGDQVKDVEGDPPGRVEERLDGRGGVQERLQVGSGHDPHAQE
jgi:hypothetical protein